MERKDEVMKIHKVQIQLADRTIFLTKHELAHRERAALEEIYTLIPVLREIKGAIPSASVGAIGDQIFLSLSILVGTGIQMDISRWTSKTRRVLEIDHSIASQLELTECLHLTRLLLAKAAMGESDSIRDFREQFEIRVKGKFANQFRRELGSRYSMTIEGESHWIQKPLLPTQYVENHLREFCFTVQNMHGNTTFKCNHIAELHLTPVQSHFLPDPRTTFSCTRIHAARSFDHGLLLHSSMESQLPIEAVGRLVIDNHTGDVIALQVEELGHNLPPRSSGPCSKYW
jgi:hypothetical protein